MLAIQKSHAQSDNCVPNILPCRIHYNGPTKVSRRFWAPVTEKDGSKTAYYRGRKLRGRVVKLPSKYIGLVVQHANQTLQSQPAGLQVSRYGDEEDDADGGDADGEEETEPVQVLEQLSSFDHLMVWGHDQTPNADDVYVKGIEEWMSFAEAIHDTPPTSTAPIEINTTAKE